MENSLPRHITNERDLKTYEMYLKNDTALSANQQHCENKIQIETPRAPARIQNGIIPETLTNPVFVQGYVKNHIGKLIKVESLIGNCLEYKVGILLSVGADYIVIKLHKGCSSMIIPTASIKYITIVHDNDINYASVF